jgi:predicted DNA-binding protein
MNPIKEWVEHHLPNKNDEDLWYLAAEVLTELSKRDKVKYRIRATDESIEQKLQSL